MTRPSMTRIIKEGYGQLIANRINDGWSGYILGMMYDHLRGGQRRVNFVMTDTVHRVHRTLVTRLFRNPNQHRSSIPILLVAKDWPVYKHQKSSLRDVMINDGCHHQGVLLMPPADPSMKLKTSIVDHFHNPNSIYTRDGTLRRIHAQPFEDSRYERIADYTLKGLRRYENLDHAYDDGALIILGGA